MRGVAKLCRLAALVSMATPRILKPIGEVFGLPERHNYMSISLRNIDNDSEIILQLERRKYLLELKYAQQGITTDPSIILEIQDIETRINQLSSNIELIQKSIGGSDDPNASFDISCSPIFWIVAIPVKLGVHIFGRVGK